MEDAHESTDLISIIDCKIGGNTFEVRLQVGAEGPDRVGVYHELLICLKCVFSTIGRI